MNNQVCGQGKKKMNKHIGFILSVLFGIVTFYAGVKYSLNEMDKQVDEWDSKYQEIQNKVSAFEKVSDPKTIRSYVKQLYEIIDNMTRLGNLIEGGEELDIVIGQYNKEYKKLHTKVFELLEEVGQQKVYRQDIKVQLEGLQDVTNFNELEMIDNYNTNKSNNLEIINRLDIIDNDLRDVKSILERLKNSKLRKYFEG